MYRKHYLPLESNPSVFTSLLHALGVPRLSFVDIYSLDPQLLSLTPRPVYALLLTFPTTPTYIHQQTLLEAAREPYTRYGPEEPVLWFRQSINNACGLYGLLHAVSNGRAREFVPQDSVLGRILDAAVLLNPEARALALEASVELEEAHRAAATQGDSVVPESAEEEVGYHYIAFVKACGRLWEMDGDSKAPVEREVAMGEEEDMLSEGVLGVVREFLEREEGDVGFSLMALVESA